MVRDTSAAVGVVSALLLMTVFALPPSLPSARAAPVMISDLQPNGGEIVTAGNSYPIRWNATHGNDPWLATVVRFGGTWITAKDVSTGPTVHPWTAPYVNTSGARIEVCAVALDGDRACMKSAANFTIEATPPFLTVLGISDGAENVSLNQEILLAVDSSINTSSVTISVSPSVPLSVYWDAGVLLHLVPLLGWSPCTRYTATFSARDVNGQPIGPYTIRFDALCPVPTLLSIDPPTVLDAPLVLTFNKPMDRGLSLFFLSPSTLVVPIWRDENRVVELWPGTIFQDCTQYNLLWEAYDLFGNPAAGPFPNPYSFGTPCALYIVWTSPADGETNVSLAAPIIVEFSGPVDRISMQFLMSPTPPTMTFTWMTGDTIFRMDHGSAFDPCTTYVVEFRSPDLGPGPVPNPWTFTTVCAPSLVETNPPDGLTQAPLRAPLTLTFSEPMNTSSVTVTFGPPVANLTFTWTAGNTTLRVDHDPFAPCTVYWVMVAGESAAGVPLIPGPVPNPWTFGTVCPDPWLTGLAIERNPPATVRLRWNSVALADFYRVYESTDRLAPFPWRVLGETTDTWFDAGDHLDDSLPHFYIVRAVFGATEGTNSTMAAKLERGVQFDPARTNIHWTSLPYRSEYRTASEIANELTEANVDVIGRWDPAARTSSLWYYFRGAWRGTDFPILPGEGFFVSALRSFSWPVVGVDSPLGLTFTAHQFPSPTLYGVALPYTSPYAKASDLVVEIEGSVDGTANKKIVEVAHWDGTAQTLWRFFWTPVGWIGTDFVLPPGVAAYFWVVADFTWQPRLLTPQVP